MILYKRTFTDERKNLLLLISSFSDSKLKESVMLIKACLWRIKYED